MISFTTLILISCATYFLKAHSADSAKLIFIQGDSVTNFKPLNVPWNDMKPLIASKSFDKTKRMILIAHGWKTGFSSPIITKLTESFLTRKTEYNIFILDWSSSASKNYLAAVSSIPIIADFVASNMKKMNGAFISVQDFYLVGHSLGSHLCGHIGRRLQEVANITLKRITGLDPAGPLFFLDLPINPVKSLRSADAEFVDIIHTNSREAGSARNIGHVDFYANDGSHHNKIIKPEFLQSREEEAHFPADNQ